MKRAVGRVLAGVGRFRRGSGSLPGGVWAGSAPTCSLRDAGRSATTVADAGLRPRRHRGGPASRSSDWPTPRY